MIPVSIVSFFDTGELLVGLAVETDGDTVGESDIVGSGSDDVVFVVIELVGNVSDVFVDIRIVDVNKLSANFHFLLNIIC